MDDGLRVSLAGWLAVSLWFRSHSHRSVADQEQPNMPFQMLLAEFGFITAVLAPYLFNAAGVSGVSAPFPSGSSEALACRCHLWSSRLLSSIAKSVSSGDREWGAGVCVSIDCLFATMKSGTCFFVWSYLFSLPFSFWDWVVGAGVWGSIPGLRQSSA